MKNRMEILDHLNITWTGLKQWMVAQMKDAVLVGILWLIGLLIIGIPLAPLWAFLGGLFQLVPILGTILALIGPVFSAAVSGNWMHIVYVFILYAVIVVIDGFGLQPILMKHTARVPVWASILVPLLLGLIFNVWGIILAPPLLAIIYTYRRMREQEKQTK